MSADRNLLFGVLALQLDFISRDQLIAGMQAWVNDKSKSLAEILVSAGTLDSVNRQLLEPLVERHIQQHGNDPQLSLATLSSADRLRRELDEIQDGDVQRSLVSLGRARSPAADPEATLDPTSLGVQTSAGTRFRILRPHARGGLGEVFVARDTELGREVALKEIQHDKSDDPDARARFTREAEITGGLEHPGIVPVYGLGAYPDGRPFYAMRFIRGKSLQEAIKAYHARDKASPTEQNLELRRLLQRFIDVCEAIDYAHSRGVLHRDLKPGNIMLGRYGETLVVDWGLAKAVGELPKQPAAANDDTKDASVSQLPEPALVPSSHGSSEATQLGSALGTIAYMSPEQANGRWDLLGPPSDVFSLGATLFHLLTGRPPYIGTQEEAYTFAKAGEYPRPRSLTRNIPAPLEAICLKSLAVRPADRYPTAQAFARDLERYLADEPIAALPESLLSRTNRWTRRNRHWMQAGSVVLLLVAVTAIGAYFYQRETALQNQKLAVEKGKLADEKGKLASEKSQLADEANAKAKALRALLTQNYFAHGLSEYAAGREHEGILDLQRALAMLPPADPLLPHYEQVLLDRAGHGTRASLPLRHNVLVWAVAFSPKGDRVVTGSSDGTARLWDARSGAPLGEPLRHDAHVWAVAFSPQGDRVLTGSYDNTARLWDARSGALLCEPLRHEHHVNSVAFSPQGDRVLTGSLDNTARLWDARTGALLCEPLRHEHHVHSVAFSPQGDRVVTGSEDKTARLWDATTGAALGEPLRHEGYVTSVAFNPLGNCVLTGSSDHSVRLWDARTGAALGEPFWHQAGVNAVAFSPQGDRILTGSEDKTARLWHARTGAPMGEPMQHANHVRAVAFSHQGDRVLTGSVDGTARLWDAQTGAPMGEPMQHANHVRAVAFSHQGDQVLTGSEDGTARLWSARYRAPLGEPLRHEGFVVAVAFSPQGDRVLTGSDDKTARLWDARSGAAIGKPLRHEGRVNVVAFNPQGDRVLTGSEDKTARLWEATTGAAIGEPLRHDQALFAVAFSPNGDYALTGSQDNTARLWDARTGAPLGEPLRHGRWVKAVTFSPQGDRVLTGSDDGTARLWDARTGAPVGKPLRHEGTVEAVAFSPKGDHVLTGCSDRTARLWDARSGLPLGEPLLHEGSVEDVAFSPQGDRVLTGSEDKTARLWDARTGAPLGEPMWHQNLIYALAFSPQGERVLTASADATARLWDARTGAPLGEPLRHEGVVVAVAFSPQGDRVLTACSSAQLWDVSVVRPKDISEHATLVTRQEVDQDGNARELNAKELEERRVQFFATETEWFAAVEKRAMERRQQNLQQWLRKGLSENDLFKVWQSARWLPAEESVTVETASFTMPAMQVLVAWFRDGKLDQVGAALRESEEMPEAGAGKVLKVLQDAIPVLYWETDERLGRLGKELAARAAEATPAK